MSQELQLRGAFRIGCNYWASHAGTGMWQDWNEDVVRRDFATLAHAGLRFLRVFPLWPDFQPLIALRGSNGDLVEFRRGRDEQPLGTGMHTSLDPTMLARLVRVAELADEYDLALIVALVTGWMSGRLFVPPALEGLNPLTHPTSLAFQTRLVAGIVDACAEQPAIHAWDLGNECNCMGRVATPEEAYHWTATIAHAIRARDPRRPIVSGMHSLSAQPRAPWRIADQGELTDFLTTHPYPYWVEHGRVDPLDSYRTTLLPTIETCLYRDLGGKPCLAEEIGSMGPMVAADAVAAGWLRANLFSLWAHDARALLWWCAFDQTQLTHAPYDWIGVETELGLFDVQRRPKPTAHELTAFAAWLREFGQDLQAPLPARTIDAVCVLTRQQDSWATAIGTFALAKQVGLELEFRFADQPLPRADRILLPCLTGAAPLRRHEWHGILERVRAGATLYLSLHDGIVPEFLEHTGLRIVRRSMRTQPSRFVPPAGHEATYEITAGDRLECEAAGATVLATDECGGVVFAQNACGNGRILTLTFPIERQLALTPGALDPAAAGAARTIYGRLEPNAHAFSCDNPELGVTEHSISEERVLVVVVNYTAEVVAGRARLATGFGVVRSWRTTPPDASGQISIPPHDAGIFLLDRI